MEVQDWLFKVENFFCIDGTPENVKVGLACIHLDGIAAKWHQAVYKKDRSLAYDWERYRGLIEERFGEILEDPMSELKLLQETDGILEYHRRFEDISTRVELVEEYLVSSYLTGLREDTRFHVKMFQPRTIRECFVLARLYEKAQPRMNITRSVAKTSKENQLVRERVFNKPVRTNSRPMLSREELERRRQQGQCFFCDEKFTPEHFRSKHKDTHLFSLMAEYCESQPDEGENDTEEEEGEVAHISVNAISGLTSCQTMRVKGSHRRQELYILIDSGSTHNFLDKNMAKRLGCNIQKAEGCRVKVANGSQIPAEGRIRNFQWQVQGVEFEADLMIIELEGCDMVLGCQWLEKLGSIV